ncbi:hypothetical protein CDAR_614171 [Caerostris darwini]|uniref:Uncharacterized protein n=1 Tax=Caerostris darwini TaxID=1538125 RepID=A0AAV4WAD2_9ARAC|nr:hypothetical protein CDAR_614171 [Caerostris darwini]
MSSNYKVLQRGVDGIQQTFESELTIFTKRTSVFWVGRLDSERDRKLSVFVIGSHGPLVKRIREEKGGCWIFGVLVARCTALLMDLSNVVAYLTRRA